MLYNFTKLEWSYLYSGGTYEECFGQCWRKSANIIFLYSSEEYKFLLWVKDKWTVTDLECMQILWHIKSWNVMYSVNRYVWNDNSFEHLNIESLY